MVYVVLSGSDFKREILEHAVGTKRGDGRFLQTAGVSFDFDRRRPAGDRVFNVKVKATRGDNLVDLNPSAPYVVAVSEYMFNCGDGYRFRNFVTSYIPPGPDVRALVARQFKGADSSPASKAVWGPFEKPDYLKELPVSNPSAVPIGSNNQCPK